MKEIKVNDKPTVPSVVNRISEFIISTEHAETNGDTDIVENRWVGFDRLVAKVGEIAPADVLVYAGIRLLTFKEEYSKNAGLTLLGTPKAIEYITDNENGLFKQIVNTYTKLIPFTWQISEISPDSPRAYNMIRSVENLLRLQKYLQNSKDNRYEAVSGVLEKVLKEDHKTLLKQMVNAPDMNETLVRDVYGTK